MGIKDGLLDTHPSQAKKETWSWAALILIAPTVWNWEQPKKRRREAYEIIDQGKDPIEVRKHNSEVQETSQSITITITITITFASATAQWLAMKDTYWAGGRKNC